MIRYQQTTHLLKYLVLIAPTFENKNRMIGAKEVVVS
jgi:hypothetical protein